MAHIMTQKLNNHSLVNVQSIIPIAILDIKYATTNNFTQAVIYPSAQCYLIHDAAHALKKVADQFAQSGYKIKLWDGYRPLKAQHIFWSLVPDERYVANPAQGSRHNRGCSVDLTLIDNSGRELDMGTDFDNFTEKAHRDNLNFPEHVLKNRQLLQTIMEKNNFIGWPHEWWHFDFIHWEHYPILDIDFNEIKL